MTEQDRQYVLSIGERIRSLPGCRHIKVYVPGEIIRIQHEKVNSAYRMLVMNNGSSPEQLREQMECLAREVARSAGKAK